MKYQTHILKNGLKVLLAKRPSQNVAVLFKVNGGSVNEKAPTRGIFHFVEHMIFEGTKKRKNSKEIAQQIENVGGEFNASSGKTKTAFYVKVPSEHAETGVKVLADVICNSVFDETVIEKEKDVVINEIHTSMDDPNKRQWYLFEQTLFQKHPAKHSGFGTKKTIQALTRQTILDHYKIWYTANNSVVCVVGNYPDNIIEILEEEFGTLPKGIKQKQVFREEKNRRIQLIYKADHIEQTYYISGYKTPNIREKECFTLDVIEAILSKGMSGWLFEEFRQKKGIAYEVRAIYDAQPTASNFCINVICQQKHIDEVKKICRQLFRKLQTVDDVTVNDAKSNLAGRFKLITEDNLEYASSIAQIELDGLSDYIEGLKRVTSQDVHKLAKSLFDDKYCEILIQQKQSFKDK